MSTHIKNEYYPEFLVFPFKILQDKKLTKTDCLVYAVAYWYENLGFKKCFASNAEIARVLGVAPSTVVTSLGRLDKGGYIIRDFFDRGRRHRKEIKTLVPIRKNIERSSDPKPRKQSFSDSLHPSDLPSREWLEENILNESVTHAGAVEIAKELEKTCVRFEDDGTDMTQYKELLGQLLEIKVAQQYGIE
ncbi:MAG: hypothetical protein CMI56_02240 [Parcubacteria group bacterium]|nr:hypothetical protein [Parcubacteria group bacterium]